VFFFAAALARRLYNRQGTGVGAFAKVFGAKQRRGVLGGHFKKASRGIIRNCLKQLERVRTS
jgi:small subunit ribosomal protein S19e